MKKFGKQDLILLTVIGIIAVILFLVYFFYPRKEAEQLLITVDGEAFGTYDLKVDQEILVRVDGNTTNRVVIANHRAYMKHAKCPDQLCIKQGKISHDGETIVCLPNRVVVQVKAEQKSEFDSVAK